MTRYERWILKRLDALLQVPMPQDGTGTKTASVNGCIAYQADMRALLPLWRETLTALATGDPDADIERNLAAMEAWHALREKDDWALSTNTPTPKTIRGRAQRETP